MTDPVRDGPIRLNLLGSPFVTAGDGVSEGFSRNPKKLAFIAYLAIQPPNRFLTRDELIGIFWPDSTDKQARHSLSQTLHHLRRLLGSDVFTYSGHQLVRLNANAIQVDVREFDDAITSGDWSKSLSLCRGDLMEDVNFFDAPELSQWLDRERERLRKAWSTALWARARLNLDQGKNEEALSDATLAVQRNPAAEDAALLFMREAEVRGRISLARRVGALYASSLEEACGDQPSSSFETYRCELDTLVSPPKDAAAIVLSERPEPMELQEAPSQRDVREKSWNKQAAESSLTIPEHATDLRLARWFMIVGSSALVILSSVMIIRAALARSSDVAASATTFEPVLSILVDTADNAAPPLANALVNELVRDLTTAGRWIVSVPRYAENHRDKPLSGYVLELHANRQHTGRSMAYRILEPKQARVLASGTVRLDHEHVAATIATEVRKAIRTDVHSTNDRQLKRQPALRFAREIHAMADSLRVKGAIDEALRQYLLADSMYATVSRPKQARMAAGLSRLRVLEAAALSAALLGKKVDSERAFNLQERVAFDLTQSFPTRVEVWNGRGEARYHRWALTRSPPDSLLTLAEMDLRQALRIGPTTPEAVANLSEVLFARGDYVAARVLALSAHEMDPLSEKGEEILVRLFLTSFNLDDDVSAVKWCDDIGVQLKNSWPGAACKLMLMGWSPVVAADPAQIGPLVKQGAAATSPVLRKQIESRLSVLGAGVLARVGQPDSARALLRRLDHSSDPEMLGLKAAVLLVLGDTAEAAVLAEYYVRIHPGSGTSVAKSRVFRPLRKP